MQLSVVRSVPLLALLTAFACSDSKPGNMAVDGGSRDVRGPRQQVFQPWLYTELDMLFVIDNANSIPEPHGLAVQVASFMNVLRGIPSGMPDLHLGVVSSDLGAGGRSDVPGCRPRGDGGRLQSAPRILGCLRPNDNYISVSEKEAVKNFDGTIEEAFACIAALGASGCAFEQPLQSAAVALGFDGSIPPENAGFLRPKALLAVIFIGGDDDCSVPADSQLFDPTQRTLSDPLGPFNGYRCNEFGHLCDGQRPPRTVPSGGVQLTNCQSAEDGVLTRVSDLALFFKSLKAEVSMISMIAIAGPREPYVVQLQPDSINGVTTDVPAVASSCNASGVVGKPAIRIADFIDQFRNGVRLPNCAPSYEAALVGIAEEASRRNVPRCLQLDVVGGTASAPDLAADCQVFEEETLVPKCTPGAESGAGRCWSLNQVASCKGAPDLNLTPDVLKTVTVRCVPPTP